MAELQGINKATFQLPEYLASYLERENVEVEMRCGQELDMSFPMYLRMHACAEWHATSQNSSNSVLESYQCKYLCEIHALVRNCM